MEILDKVGFQTTKTFLHRILKNPSRPDKEAVSFFNNFFLFKNHFAKQVSHLDTLEPCLDELVGGGGRYGELLRRRFWKGETIRHVASYFHLSMDQVNTLQREAIVALTNLILSKEEPLKKAATQKQLDGLPFSTYSRLFGFEKIERELIPVLLSPKEPWIVALCGLGGIGKTALADSLARAAIDSHYFKNVFWIRMPVEAETISLEGFYRILAQQLLDEPVPSASQPSQLRRLLKESLSLVILDNLEGELDPQDWIEPMRKLVKPSRFLITSRKVPSDISDIYILQLGELDLPSATQLLEYQAQITGLNQPVASFSERIYRVVGGNPLALRLVIGLLHTWSLSDVLISLQQGKGRKPEQLFKSIYQNAWNALEQKSKKVFEAMMFCGNEGFANENLAIVTGSTEVEAREAIRDFALRSLIEKRGQIENTRYGIHHLTETFLWNLVINQESDRKSASQQALINIDYWIRSFKNQGKGIFDTNQNNLHRAVELGLELGQGHKAMKLLMLLFPQILDKRLASSWIMLFKPGSEFIAAAQNLEIEGELSNQLGALYWQLGQYNLALESFQRAYEISLANNQRENQVAARMGMAITWWSKRDYAKANQEVRQVYEIRLGSLTAQELEGKLVALQGIIAYMRKRYPSAIRHFSKAAKYFKHGNPTFASQLILNRGLSLQIQKKYSTALKQYRIAEHLFGDRNDVPYERVQIELLRSSAFYQMGDLRNSEAALKRAAAINPQTSQDLQTQAFIESSLGRVYLGLGKKRKGRAFLKSAKLIWKATGNPEFELDVLGFFSPGTE